MGFIFFIFFIIYVSRMNKDNRASDIIKYFFFGIIAISILSTVWFIPFGGLFGILFIVFIIKKINKRIKDNEKQKMYDSAFGAQYSAWNNQAGSSKYEYSKAGDKKFDPLPQSLKKRKKIVKEFSEKNDLFLTDEQITSIANSSYMSNYWKAEIVAMQQKYEVIYEWFRGYTGWLRTYMYVFRVQEITSDFTQQQKIVAYAFNEVMNYSDTLVNMPMSMRIKMINEKFFTNFDDITFMTAYRFLEDRGIKHNLSEGEIVNADSHIDDLLDKYKVDEKGAV